MHRKLGMESVTFVNVALLEEWDHLDVMQETFKNLSAVEAKSLRDSLAKNLVNMQ
jgi:gamma-glutamylcysteine synthetase